MRRPTSTRPGASPGRAAAGTEPACRWRCDRPSSRHRKRCTAPARTAAPRSRVTAGFTGTLGTDVSGLVGTTPQADHVETGPFDPPNPSPATDRREVVVPAGTKLARFDVDGAAGDDLDLYVYQVVGGEETLVDFSADGDAEETVTLANPEAATYVTYVNGFATPDGGDYDWSQWVVPPTAAGNLTVTPASVPVTVGQTYTLDGRLVRSGHRKAVARVRRADQRRHRGRWDGGLGQLTCKRDPPGGHRSPPAGRRSSLRNEGRRRCEP